MLFNGEVVGDGSAPSLDIAVDPIDGTTLTSLGRYGAISVIAMSERGTMFNPGPCVYMEKIATGPAAADAIDLNAPVKANLEAVAKALGEKVSDVTAVILDRDRHEELIRECREAGARIRLIPDGDVAGAISVAWRNSGTDVLFGIGGTPEGVIAACALKSPRRNAPRPALAPQRGRTTGCARPGLRPRPGPPARRPRVRRRRVLRRHRHQRRRAAPRRSVPGRRRQHPEPGDALEIGHDPHDRRRPPLDQAHVVLRHLLRLTPTQGLHVHCTNFRRSVGGREHGHDRTSSGDDRARRRPRPHLHPPRPDHRKRCSCSSSATASRFGRSRRGSSTCSR